MGRIIEQSEASGVSTNDYVLLSSPTLGERKFKAINFQSGSSGVENPLIPLKVVHTYAGISTDNRTTYTSTHTATKKGYFLAFNQYVNGQANVGMSATFETSGILLFENAQSNNTDSSNLRCHATTCALFLLDVGDTVTFVSTFDSSHPFKNRQNYLHLGFFIDEKYKNIIQGFSLIELTLKADNTYGESTTVSLSEGYYFVVNYEYDASMSINRVNAKLNFTGDEYDNTKSIINADVPGVSSSRTVACSASIFEVDGTSSMQAIWNTSTNYMSKGYVIYSLI